MSQYVETFWSPAGHIIPTLFLSLSDSSLGKGPFYPTDEGREPRDGIQWDSSFLGTLDSCILCFPHFTIKKT